MIIDRAKIIKKELEMIITNLDNIDNNPGSPDYNEFIKNMNNSNILFEELKGIGNEAINYCIEPLKKLLLIPEDIV